MAPNDDCSNNSNKYNDTVCINANHNRTHKIKKNRGSPGLQVQGPWGPFRVPQGGPVAHGKLRDPFSMLFKDIYRVVKTKVHKFKTTSETK